MTTVNKQNLNLSLEGRNLLHRLSDRIRRLLELEDILETTSSELQKFTGVNRVMIYKFHEDGSVKVVAESREENKLPSLMGLNFPADDIPDYARELFIKSRICSIVNLETEQISQSCFHQIQNGETENITKDFFNRSVDPCHIEYLTGMGVKLSLLMPIMYHDGLWGLLVGHNAEAREVSEDEIEAIQMVVDLLSIAIAQNTIKNQLEAQVIQRTESLQQTTEQQQILFDVVTKMRESLDIETIFSTMSAEVRRALKADRVGVYHFDPTSKYNEGEFVAEDVLEGIPSALAVKVHDHCFGDIYATKYLHGRVNAISNIYEAGLEQCFLDVLSQFQIQATLVAPIMKGDKLWGLLCIHQCTQPRDWQASEIQFAIQVATQLSVAIEQADLLAETQNKTEKLAKALEKLKQTQTQLIQTEKMSSLGQLVAGIAHEINNPVNFIYGNIKHISQYSEDLLSILNLYQQNSLNITPEIIERAEEIDLDFLIKDLPNMLASVKVGTERIRQIVLSLRNFSRLDHAEIKPVNIHDGIESSLVILQYRLKAKPESPAIEIIRDYENLPEVECYAGQLNQVFMNVLSNAIDALEERREKDSVSHVSQITIQTNFIQVSDKKPSVAIRISDNGLGMPEDMLKSIFDPFFTTKPIGKGTGLGLSISYQIIVDQHGGIIKCHSQKGEGTEFLIEIPVKVVRN
jgi:light-regulated signal transduction histidine kinase (bacteriophytochrome)